MRRARAVAPSIDNGVPSSRTSPAISRWIPASACISVVLPLPLLPSTAQHCPALTSKDSPRHRTRPGKPRVSCSAARLIGAAPAAGGQPEHRAAPSALLLEAAAAPTSCAQRYRPATGGFHLRGSRPGINQRRSVTPQQPHQMRHDQSDEADRPGERDRSHGGGGGGHIDSDLRRRHRQPQRGCFTASEAEDVQGAGAKDTRRTEHSQHDPGPAWRCGSGQVADAARTACPSRPPAAPATESG